MSGINSVVAFTGSNYEEILNLPAHLVAIISGDGKFIQTNNSAQKLLGWDQAEVSGKNIQEYIYPADMTLALSAINTLLKGEEVAVERRLRCLKKDGGYCWISWTAIAKEGTIFALGTDATQRVETENALIQKTIIQKEYQTRYTTFFEQSTLPMQIYSLEGTPLAVNKAWEELFATTIADLEGYNVLQDPQIRRSSLWQYLQKAYKGEAVEVPAFWYDPALIGKKGRARWLEAWISPVKDETSGIREIAMILKDVTDKIETQKALVQSISQRKAAEEKFQILSERLGLAVKAGNIGIWEWIPGTSHVYWDETTERLYGYEVGEFPCSSETFTDHIHSGDQLQVWNTIHQALKDKKSFRVDHRIIRKDGVQRWVQESGTALFDEKGNPYHMMGTVMDITERVQAEADQKFLSQAAELLNVSFDHREILKTLCDHAINYFCDGVFVDQLHPEGDLKRLMVVHPDPVVMRKLFKVDEDFPLRYESNPVLNPLITGKSLFVENADEFWKKIRLSHGEEYYNAVTDIGTKSSIRVRLKGRESVLGMITFFTTKNSGKELTRAHVWLCEELAYRASMAFENALIHQSSQEAIKSRDEFLSIASHELKTPLQSLTLQNQMRKRNLDKKIFDSFTPDKIYHMIEADLRHLMRITRLIDDMLDISRIRAGKLTFINEQVEFCSFVRDVLERFRPQLDAAGCYLTSRFCPEVDTEIDMYRTEQVIVNLLTNAMKYGAGKPIRVEVIRKNERVQLQVHDQGPGIKEEDTERIFQRFERAISSNEVSGLGLGLYISRQIMEQNRGSLFVRSTPGKGSTFIMDLPVQQ